MDRQMDRQTESDAYEPTVQKHKCAQKLEQLDNREQSSSDSSAIGIRELCVKLITHYTLRSVTLTHLACKATVS